MRLHMRSFSHRVSEHDEFRVLFFLFLPNAVCIYFPVMNGNKPADDGGDPQESIEQIEVKCLALVSRLDNGIGQNSLIFRVHVIE